MSLPSVNHSEFSLIKCCVDSTYQGEAFTEIIICLV